MDILTIVLLLFLISLPTIYFLQIYLKWKKTADLINKIPGPKTYPIIGTAWQLLNVSAKDTFEFFKHRAKTYNPIFRVWAGPIPEVHIMKAEQMEIIMSTIKHSTKGLIYEFLQPWLGFGLLTSSGPHWHAHRKLITPTFHFKILENFFEVFSEKSTKLVEQLGKKADGKPFNIFPIITHCTLDMICETAMGVEINAMDKSDSDYVSAVYKISELTMQRAVRPWLHNDFFFYNLSKYGKLYAKNLRILHNFTTKVIRDRRELYKSNKALKHTVSEEDLLLGKKKKMAFLDLLIEASNDDKSIKLTDVDIREEVDTFMFEGHDTTTAGICWSLFLLGNHPDVQAKVADELHDIFGGEDRPITLEDLNQMKYLERVLKEALRLYPSVPYISRIVGEDIEIDGYAIPRGCMAVLHIYDMHRDELQFPNPDHFDPDHFLPENCQKRHPYAYVPFSAGPRNCVGQKFAIMEEKTLLAAILRKFKVTSMETPQEIKVVAELILRPENGHFVTLEPRKYLA